MILCVIVWSGIIGLFFRYKKRKFPWKIKEKEAKYFFLVLIASNLTATTLFMSQLRADSFDGWITRNTYGGGERTENYEVTIEGEFSEEALQVKVNEQEYTYEETKVMFEEIIRKLDKVVLGENETFDRVE